MGFSVICREKPEQTQLAIKSPPHMVPSCPNSFHSIPPWSPPSPTVSPTPSQIRRRSQAGRAGLERGSSWPSMGSPAPASLMPVPWALIDTSGNQLVLTVRRYGSLPPPAYPQPPSPGLPLPVSTLCLTDLTSATNKYLFLLVYFAGARMFVPLRALECGYVGLS